jgi:hypothetical protein
MSGAPKHPADVLPLCEARHAEQIKDINAINVELARLESQVRTELIPKVNDLTGEAGRLRQHVETFKVAIMGDIATDGLIHQVRELAKLIKPLLDAKPDGDANTVFRKTSITVLKWAAVTLFGAGGLVWVLLA